MATGAAATFKKIWRSNRWLTLSFLLTSTLALVFIIRAGVFLVYWQNHADEPVEGWMTIRYVANSYRVDPKIIHDALGLPRTGPDRRPLIRIARERGQPLDALTSAIVDAIEADRASHPRPAGPPPPSPPTPLPPPSAPPASRQP